MFILNEVDAGTTRLILRTRVNYGPRLFRVLTRQFFWPIDFVLARKMLRGIKGRVEQSKGLSAVVPTCPMVYHPPLKAQGFPEKTQAWKKATISSNTSHYRPRPLPCQRV